MKNNHLNIKTSHFSNNKFSQKHNHKGGKKKYKTLKAYKSYRSLKGGEPTPETIEKIKQDIKAIEDLLNKITSKKDSSEDKPIVNTFEQFIEKNEFTLNEWEAVTEKLLKALDSIDFNKGLEDLPAKKKELLDKIRTLNRIILIEVIDAELKSNLNTEEDQKAALELFNKYLQDMPSKDISTEIDRLSNTKEFDLKLPEGENESYNTLRVQIIKQIKKDLENILEINKKLTDSSDSSDSISSVQDSLDATSVTDVSKADPVNLTPSSTQPEPKISLATAPPMASDETALPVLPQPAAPAALAATAPAVAEPSVAAPAVAAPPAAAPASAAATSLGTSTGAETKSASRTQSDSESASSSDDCKQFEDFCKKNDLDIKSEDCKKLIIEIDPEKYKNGSKELEQLENCMKPDAQATLLSGETITMEPPSIASDDDNITSSFELINSRTKNPLIVDIADVDINEQLEEFRDEITADHAKDRAESAKTADELKKLQDQVKDLSGNYKELKEKFDAAGISKPSNPSGSSENEGNRSEQMTAEALEEENPPSKRDESEPGSAPPEDKPQPVTATTEAATSEPEREPGSATEEDKSQNVTATTEEAARGPEATPEAEVSREKEKQEQEEGSTSGGRYKNNSRRKYRKNKKHNSKKR